MAATIRNSRLLAEAAAAMPTSTMASVNSAPPYVTRCRTMRRRYAWIRSNNAGGASVYAFHCIMSQSENS